MNEKEARQKIKALKAFYGHLLLYAVFIGCLAVVNVMTFAKGDHEIWVIYPAMFWGAVVFLQGVAVQTSFGWGKKWEEEKFRELTGWNAAREELARLSERVDTLLKISSSDDAELDAELDDIRKTLLDAKRAINHYQSPLAQPPEAAFDNFDKHAMMKAIEKLEALLTSRAFQRLDDATNRADRRTVASP
jgi:hypothetical protein